MYIKMLNNKKGMSLVEMSIAITVFSVVILTVGTLYVTGIREFNRCLDMARVQKAAFFALDHIFLNLMGAGTKEDGGIDTIASSSIIVWKYEDITRTTRIKIKYELVSVGTINRIKFTPKVSAPTNFEYITDSNVTVSSLTFDRPLKNSSGNTINNYVTISITVSRGSISQTYSTGVTIRGMSGA